MTNIQTFQRKKRFRIIFTNLRWMPTVVIAIAGRISNTYYSFNIKHRTSSDNHLQLFPGTVNGRYFSKEENVSEPFSQIERMRLVLWVPENMSRTITEIHFQKCQVFREILFKVEIELLCLLKNMSKLKRHNNIFLACLLKHINMQAPTRFPLYLNSGIFHFPGDNPILLLCVHWSPVVRS